jgi:hypothetical protein
MQSEQLVENDYKNWPTALPVRPFLSSPTIPPTNLFRLLPSPFPLPVHIPMEQLLIHGISDQVTSPKATQVFFNNKARKIRS